MVRDPRSSLKSEYGKRLLHLRTSRGLTQKGLARRVHVSYGTIGNIEKGRTFPQPLVRRRIATFFGTDEWLLPLTPDSKSIPISALPAGIREDLKHYDVIHGPPGITILVNPETVPLSHRKIAMEMAVEMQKKFRENKEKG